MKGHKKKKYIENSLDFWAAGEEAFTTLLEAIVEEEFKHTAMEHDAFEVYQHRLHSHLHADLFGFNKRFNKGYKILLDEMRSL